MHPFKKGDIVVLKTGTAPQRVLDVGRHNGDYAVRTVYLSDPYDTYETQRRWRVARDYQLYNREADEPATENTTMADLYQTKTGEALFGTLLARNSAGRLVLEIKGTGQVRDFAPDEVEIVRPYTVRVRNMLSGQTLNMTSAAGAVAKNDIVIHDGGVIYVVEAVDTKSAKTSGSLSGRKLVTEAFASVEDNAPAGE